MGKGQDPIYLVKMQDKDHQFLTKLDKHRIKALFLINKVIRLDHHKQQHKPQLILCLEIHSPT